MRDYPHVRPYINVARQILVRLIKNPAEKIQWNTIRKGHSPISMNRIRTVLADAGIVNGTLQNNVVSPGPLTAKLRIHRFQSRSIHDSQVKECTREALGVLTISIVRRYLKDIEEDRGSQKVPQSILAPLRIIAYNIMTSGLDKNRPINEKMTEYSLTSACVRLTRRQKEKIQEGMIGAIEGSPHIISEVDRTGAVSFKAEVINFMRLVRERYRERLRSRERIRI